jgi:uncharacterized membrane protein
MEHTMTLRLQEVHPSLVHFPIALFPVSIGTDVVGRATGNRGLLETARHTIELAAVGAALAGVSGLVAQEEVKVEGETLDMLITHRNLNIAATLVMGALALWRSRRYRPSLGYLGLGLAGVGALTYSAYLGGSLVYKHGVGVEAAGGQYRENPPELGEAGENAAFARDAAVDLVHGVKHLGKETAEGKIVPSLTDGARRRSRVAAKSESTETA